MVLEEKINFVQIGDSEETRDLANAFTKQGGNVAIVGFRERIGQYVIHKTLDLEYCCFGKVNLRALPHTTQMLDIRDYTDPIEWEKMLDSIMLNKNVNKLFKEVVECSGNLTEKLLKEHGKEYAGFKKILKKALAPRYLFLSKECQVYCSEQLLDQADNGILGNIANLFYHLIAVEVTENTRDRLGNNRLSKAEELNEDGDKLNEAKKYKDALPCLEESIKISPRFCLAWINKGISLKNLGRLDEAISCYEHVLTKLNPEYKKAWYNKANALYFKEELKEARKCVDSVLDLDPFYTHALALKIKLGSMI